MNIDLIRLGRLGYRDAWNRQLARREAVLDGRLGSALFLVEHPPVITLGAGFHPANLLVSGEAAAARGLEIERTDRGGDVTYHGPGQLVAYPVFDLAAVFERDLHRWLRALEEAFVRALAEFGLVGRRFPPHSGVWIGERKAAAIGVKVRRWVSTHGVALNVSGDLSGFADIVPCGIADYGVTSIAAELGREVSVAEAEGPVVRGFEAVFGVEAIER